MEETTMKETKRSRLLPLNIQFFADGDGEGADGSAAGEGAAAAGTGADDKGQGAADDKQTGLTMDEIKKLIQSETDKKTSALGKEIANLRKENETLKTEKMTAEEKQKYEASKREEELNERDKKLTDRENRLYAVKAANTAGLDLGKDLEHIDCIMGNTSDEIDKKVTAVKTWVDKLVAAKVAETFKANGRNPNGGNGANGGEASQDTSIVAEIGKQAAEAMKKSNDILKQYNIGG